MRIRLRAPCATANAVCDRVRSLTPLPGFCPRIRFLKGPELGTLLKNFKSF
jgi:hypothetical protein